MKTSLKVILIAFSIAAVASPITAQSLITRPHVEQSAANILTALVATGTRVVGWTRPERICRDCVLRMEP